MSAVFDRNLDLIAARHGPTADRIRTAIPRPLQWQPSQQPGFDSATLEDNSIQPPRRITLASRVRPEEEAKKFADTADFTAHAAIVILGFGIGHHVRELINRSLGKALVVIYEPDASLLAAVLDRIDFTGVLAHPSVELLVGDVTEADLIQRLERHAGVITQGVQFLSHPSVRQLSAAAVGGFMPRFNRMVASIRTNMATTLVNAAVTCRNLVNNLGRYAAGPTVNELHGAAAGHPAVVVAAGPSLARNIDLLSEPGVRDRVVIIAAQTVLKPLLDRGIEPHFVTALDYHEISRRFYEDLPPMSGVTLVAEPKANKAILDHFPGPIRVLHNRFLDLLLGPAARPITPIPAGSTVAHLSVYLAQHLGCDPIILIGQDLGFSDGLYYCPGTAIHDVWAPEFNAFNTVEMMEWRRIARHKSHLKKKTDVHGRPIYSDDQMLTYLSQFERDFAAAQQKIIDATEGGMPKLHTTAMPLAQALARYAVKPLPPLPQAGLDLDAMRLSVAERHLRRRIEDVEKFRQVSVQTQPVLKAMLADQRDQRKMDCHFIDLEKLKRQAMSMDDTFKLINDLNQLGVFKRLRADRAIRAAENLDPYERQAMQLERDLENLQWLIESCDETLETFNQSLERITAMRKDADRPELQTIAAHPAKAGNIA